MRKIRTLPLTTLLVLILLLSSSAVASAGLFRGPYDFSLGPYTGGQPWSPFESYNYFGVASTAEFPYWATGIYPYYWESPYTWGSGSRYPSIFGYPRRPGFYNPINPNYLIPPRAPGYTKASARNVQLPPMNQVTGLAAIIDIKMPCFGDLWVDGFAMEQLGTDRLFRSPPLEKGCEYVYTVKARWLDSEGKIVEQTQDVRVHSGERLLLIFPKPTHPAEPRP
ncbi:MAG TPA: TIGR03000 domain-containing protein [Gemmataceae bacterium]|nr:TIGR03000 domain-containing protein [Gemmataceae bacterium]